MDAIRLFDVASQHSRWLSVRQSTIAGNIANVNTPGFEALDTKPFEAVLNSTRLELATTRPGHISQPGGGAASADVQKDGAWEVLHSGNTVTLERELLKAGEVSGGYALNTGVVKAFHRMLLASTRG